MDTVEPIAAEQKPPSEVATVGGLSRPVDAAEQALVTNFNTIVKVAPFLQQWYERFDVDRKYVNEELLMIDDEDVVATNYIFRNQIILGANLFARDPAISWKPQPMVGDPPPLLAEFGKTLEIFCHKQAEEVELRRLMRTGIQEASGIGWAIFKLRVQEDYKRDSLGARRQDDQLDNLARLDWLRKRKASGQFNEGDALERELKDCEAVVAQYVQAKIEEDLLDNPMMIPPPMDPMTGQPLRDLVTGEPMTHQPDPSDPRLAHLEALKNGQIPEDYDLPEVARFLGYSLELLQAEDFRFDWTVSRTVDIYKGEWMAHRTWMTYDDFGSKFDVTPEEMGNIVLYGPDGRQMGADKRWTKAGPISASWFDSEGPSDRKTMETNSNMGRCAVWEMWHHKQGRVYVWVEGMPRFLMNYVPEHPGRRWFPFYILYFNPVVGRAVPISDTGLTRLLQNELNRRRTHEAEAQKAAYPKILIRKGSMTDTEKQIYENANPYQVIELETPEEVAKAVMETKPLPFNRDLYDRTETRLEFEMMSGVSRNASGSASSEGELATTAAVANEQMGIQVDFRKSMVEEVVFDILYDMAFIGIQIYPEENIIDMCGDGAHWPLIDRETFLRKLKLDVRAGSTGRPDSEKRLAIYEQFAGIAMQLGLPVDGEALMEEIMYEMGVADWRKFLLTPQKALQRMAMGLPAIGGPAGAQGGQPPGGAMQNTSHPRGNAAKPSPTPGAGSKPYAQTGPPAPSAIPGPK